MIANSNLESMILENCGIESPTSADYVRVRGAMGLAIREAFRNIKVPQKVVSIPLDADSAVVSLLNFGLVHGVTYGSYRGAPALLFNKGEEAIDLEGIVSKIYSNAITIIEGGYSQLVFTFGQTDAAGWSAEVVVTETDLDTQKVLNSSIFNLESGIDNVLTINSYQNASRVKVGVDVFLVIPQAGLDYPLPLISLVKSPSLSRIALPSDYYIGFELNFRDKENRTMLSQEMPMQQFVKWIPLITPDNITAYNTSLLTSNYTDANASYDGTVGFYITHEQIGHFVNIKPAITGYLDIAYAYVPVVDLSPAGQTGIADMFAELLVAGGSYRMLLKKLLTAKSEVEIVTIRALIEEYRAKEKTLKADFTFFLNKSVEAVRIEGFSIIDFSMED